MASLEQVRKTSLRTDDFLELQEASTNWDQEYLQLSPGLFTGSIESVQVGSTQIMRKRWERKIRYRGTAPPGAFGFALAMAHTKTANWVGRKVGADTVILQAPDQEADLVPPDLWDALVISVAKEDVQRLVRALSGDYELSGEFHGTIALSSEVAKRLRRLGMDFLRQSELPTSDSVNDVILQSEKLVEEFVWEVTKAKGSSEFYVEPLKHASIVRNATDLAITPGLCDVGLAELCARLGISLRTLHYAFQDVTGLSPATWLRRIRLNQVHVELKRSSPEHVSIKDVARKSGFFHYGHFSEQYQHLFGIPPIQALKSN